MNLVDRTVEILYMTISSSRQPTGSVTAFGEEKTIGAWARDPRCMVKYATLYSRIVRAGWNPELAIKTSTHRGVVLMVSPAVTLPRR